MSRDDEILSVSGPSEDRAPGTGGGKCQTRNASRGRSPSAWGPRLARVRRRCHSFPPAGAAVVPPGKVRGRTRQRLPLTDAETRQQSVLVHLDNGKFRHRRSDRRRCLLPRWRSGSKARRSYRYRTLDFRWEALFRCRRAVIDGPDKVDTEVLGVDLRTATRRGGRPPACRSPGSLAPLATAGLQRLGLMEHKPCILPKLDNFLYKPKNSLATHENRRRRI